MPASRPFFLPQAEDDDFSVLHSAPKIAAPFPLRKSFLYGLIFLLWLCFGIFGRDAWKPEETLITAAIANYLQVETLLSLTTFGLENRPPLYLWLAAQLAAGTAVFLPLHEGARLANVLLLLAGFICTGLAVRRLYGTRTAWLALLLLVGCLGFVVRAHILNFGVPAFFGMALALLAVTILADENRRITRTFFCGGLIGLAAAFTLLACGVLPALVVLSAVAIVRKEQLPVLAVVAAFFVPVLLFARLNNIPLFAVADGRFDTLATIFAGLSDVVRVMGWSLLPLLPLALYGLWHTRGRDLNRVLYFCLFAIAATVVVFFIQGSGQEDYYLLLPPLALVTAGMLRKLPDGTASVMDFFALLIIGLGVVGGLWLCWAALYWGSPAPLAAFIAEMFVGYTLPPPSAIKITIAAVLTLGWVLLLVNFGRSNERAVVNWSCGVTLVWAIFNLLLVAYVDSGKSYRQPAEQLLAVVGDDCITLMGDQHWRAQLFYFGVRLGEAGACRYYLDKSEKNGALIYVSRNESRKGYYLYRRF